MNDLAGALMDCDKAIQLDPAYGFAFLNRGILKDAQQDYKGACVDWNKAKQLGVELASKYLEVCE
jgi:tetratricopeptide (TPR) repeat protein